ncbi:hypothetical protein NC652_041695 [Populus alba x Populus x berolinensis]|uniref:Uncharacterized protein n=1 Tax=Populus alba x Populus x berolinensis TaxID=444605 RepID=A0AAD6L9P2_9ROSI|nr:hypothetical protein NC652_041695 [Populus alba x Populus x berolinensis]KAJ6952874.1 hypothetical protein NC653_041885 [Populus alba x Populus x berolinensis]
MLRNRLIQLQQVSIQNILWIC